MEYISRADWGAAAPRSKTQLPGPVEGVAMHWQGPRMGDFSHSSCDDKVRGIQRYHMGTKGWADIAYNWLVCPHGHIFEGRGWDVRSAANGTDFGNSRYHAACYLGGEGDPLTALAKLAYQGLVAESRRRWPNGQLVRPHSFFRVTACPGDELRNWIATNPWAQPAPGHGGTVYSPPLALPPIVGSAKHAPSGGVWLLAGDGAVYALEGAPYLGAPNGQPYWGARRAARIAPTVRGYVITATSGEQYHYPV